MADIAKLEPPRAKASHVDIRFDVERDTAISAQWNTGRTHLIVSFGGYEGGLRVLLRPHAVQRLLGAITEAAGSDGEFVRA